MPSDKPRYGPLLRALQRLDRGIEFIERVVLAGSVLLMAAVTITNVIGRNVFDHSLIFADEFNQILIILTTFMGIGYGVRHGRHIRMTAVHDQLQGLPRKILMVIVSLGTAALMFVLAWYALAYVEKTYQIGSVTPAMQIPLYLVYMWAPVGFVLGGIQYLLAAVRNLTSPGVHLSFQKEDEYEDEPESYAL